MDYRLRQDKLTQINVYRHGEMTGHLRSWPGTWISWKFGGRPRRLETVSLKEAILFAKGLVMDTTQTRLERLQELHSEFTTTDNSSGREDYDEMVESPETIKRFALVTLSTGDRLHYYLKTFDTTDAAMNYAESVLNESMYVETAVQLFDLDMDRIVMEPKKFKIEWEWKCR